MADHIDYAAQFFGQHVRWPETPIAPNEFPWVGLAILMFQYLDQRGFKVVRE